MVERGACEHTNRGRFPAFLRGGANGSCRSEVQGRKQSRFELHSMKNSGKFIEAVDEMGNEPVTWKGRLMSFSLIALVWLIVRLTSELHPIRWEKAFFNMAVVFSAWSATVGFLIAIFAANRRDQTWFRCFSFWPFPIGLLVFTSLGEFGIHLGYEGIVITIFQFSVLMVSHWAYQYKFRKGA